jgi:DNA relaxase NicK
MWYDNSTLVDCGFDYFTTTATDNPTAKLLLLQAEGILFREQNRGFYTQPWRMKGYSGWRCGRLEFGWREDGAIVRCSSSLAADEWWGLYQTTERCSRIDLQATVKLPIHPKVAVLDIHFDAEVWQRLSENGPKITLWTDNRAGATMYLGCRQSDLYFRAYNKEAESADEAYKGCVRLELEIKGRLAKRSIIYALGQPTVQAGVLSQLSQYLSNRGISTNFPMTVPCSFYEQSTIATDELRSLAWLADSVKPTVARLLERGRLTQVLDNLGLSEFVPKCQMNCDTL